MWGLLLSPGYKNTSQSVPFWMYKKCLHLFFFLSFRTQQLKKVFFFHWVSFTNANSVKRKDCVRFLVWNYAFPCYISHSSTTGQQFLYEEEKDLSWYALFLVVVNLGFLLFDPGFANISLGPCKRAKCFSGSRKNKDHDINVKQNLFR